MTVKVFDKSKSIHEPRYEAVMFKMLRPDGSYHIDAGPISIMMDASEKENLVAEWALLERLHLEWRAQGNACDHTDPDFLQFMTDGHQTKQK